MFFCDKTNVILYFQKIHPVYSHLLFLHIGSSCLISLLNVLLPPEMLI